MVAIINGVIKKETASKSIVCKGSFDGIKAYFKIFYNSDDVNYMSFDYEARMYQELNKNNNCRQYVVNILDYQRMTCGTIKNFCNIETVYNDFMEEMGKIKKALVVNGIYQPSDMISVMVTEDNECVSLYDFLKNYRVPNVPNVPNVSDINIYRHTITKILFILLSGIYTLNNNGCYHNDIHWGNVLIKEEKTVYNICVDPANIFNIECDYKVLIYDFDRSFYKSGNIVNPILNNGL